MTEKVEQCICIKFRQKLGPSCSETYDLIQRAFGNEAMGHMKVKEWFRWFKEGRTSAESDEHSGRPATSRNQVTIDKVHSAVLDNHRITIRELSDELGLSFGSVQSILTEDLGMKCISAKFVPKLLTVVQKETRLAVARDLLQCADQDADFMRTIITGDESWV
jgi:AraC-like DNA-binding protein